MRLIAICSLILVSASLMAGWHDRKAEGWAWYEDRAKEKIEEPQEESPVSDEVSDARKVLEEKLVAALSEPTPENVRSYMTEQKKWVDKSAQFALVWNQVLLENPHLDNTVTSRPVSQYGLQVYKADKQQKKEHLIRELSKGKGLLFFYEGSSLLAKAFMPIVKDFSEKYQWEILAISVDGVALETLPTQRDNGLSQKLEVQAFPALMIIDPITDNVTPVAYGLLSLEKIEENIVLQYSEFMEN